MAKYFIFLALLFSSCCEICLAQEMIFPFTVDQNTKNEDIKQLLQANKDIQTDKWFVSPLTRLELLTYIMDEYFQKEINRWHMVTIEKYFEPQYRHASVEEKGNVYFSSTGDVFVATVSVTGLGKPNKPMKEVCSEILNSVDTLFMGGGYLYHNTFLRTFIQGDPYDPEIKRIAEKLEKKIIVGVSLEASFDKEKHADTRPQDFYTMQCIKTPEEKQIHYSKSSYTIAKRK
jgi:hypothetical protein